MHNIKNNQTGFGAPVIALIIIVIALTAGIGVFVYQRTKSTPPTISTPTSQTDNKDVTDPTANWTRVESTGGAYSIKAPDGWELTKYPDNIVNSDNITFTEGQRANVTTTTTTYAGDLRKFNIGFTDDRSGEDPAPQWQSPNAYGTEAVVEFSIGNIKGKRYSIEYTQTVTGVTKGDKVYQYTFDLPNNRRLGIVYMQNAGDTDNLKVVEQAIKTISIN